MTNVKCKVRSCYYWGSGDTCKADTILVDSVRNENMTGMEIGDLNVNRRTNTQRRTGAFETGTFDFDRKTVGQTERTFTANRNRDTLTDLETGDLTSPRRAGTNEQNLAYTSETTCCRTFRPRGTAHKS